MSHLGLKSQQILSILVSGRKISGKQGGRGSRVSDPEISPLDFFAEFMPKINQRGKGRGWGAGFSIKSNGSKCTNTNGPRNSSLGSVPESMPKIVISSQ